MLHVARIAGTEEMLDPRAPRWSSVAGETLALKGTPVGTQPTSYMRSAWKDREIGAVEAVEVRACHNDEAIFIRLEWRDRTADGSLDGGASFVDAAAVAFPLAPNTPIDTMGNEKAGVNAWQWKADSPSGRSVVAHGLGTTEPTADAVATAAVREGDRWQVVLSRRLDAAASGGSSVALAPGATTSFGVAVWEGSNGERAGFKAYTEQWLEMQLAAS